MEPESLPYFIAYCLAEIASALWVLVALGSGLLGLQCLDRLLAGVRGWRERRASQKAQEEYRHTVQLKELAKTYLRKSA